MEHNSKCIFCNRQSNRSVQSVDIEHYICENCGDIIVMIHSIYWI